MIPRVFVYLILLIYGGLIPLHKSLKALKSENKKDISKWLLHWTLFSMYLMCLCVTNPIFGFWLPFYNDIILFIFLWLTSPKPAGGEFVYQAYVKPVFSDYEKIIDANIVTLPSKAFNAAIKLFILVLNHAIEIAAEALRESDLNILNHFRDHCLTEMNQKNGMPNPKDNTIEEHSYLSSRKRKNNTPNPDRLEAKKQKNSAPNLKDNTKEKHRMSDRNQWNGLDLGNNVKEEQRLAVKNLHNGKPKLEGNAKIESRIAMKKKKNNKLNPMDNSKEDDCLAAKNQKDGSPDLRDNVKGEPRLAATDVC